MGVPRRRCCKEGSRFLPLMRLAPTLVSFVLYMTLEDFLMWRNVANYLEREIITGTFIYWDLLLLTLGRRKFDVLSRELAIIVEITLIALELYIFVPSTGTFESYLGGDPPEDAPRGNIVQLILWVLTIVTTLFFSYQHIRAYPAYWRLRRIRRGIKPIVGFCDTGDLVAVVPGSPFHDDIAIQRLSIDSLQQLNEYN
ncbi:hypothetical protein F5Y14DRAFT_63364 [Nemania sp. NC0429]|nr:hypothetical protein F5Y14DRAFT_63364 [Nemania sp. NC0429]